ncbi:VOC family protein [Nonomuraea sp. B1E8]|uniref:VOC family protein n=1 Tax=unclassified Nonomuraea TaxID=2593643 RepID=UPI00325D0D61
MPSHGLTSLTIGVPDVEETERYYTDFGLTPLGGGRLATLDGGEQLRLTYAPTRRIIELCVGVDDPDDLDRVERGLRGLDLATERATGSVSAVEPVTGVRATVEIAPRPVQEARPAPVYNGPGRIDRQGARADGVLRDGRVRPRKLGHAVLGSTDQEATQRFFTEGLGFKVSDLVAGRAAFLRCSTDHHNLLVQRAPVAFLHHTSWQVDDVDEVGRGAMQMLEEHPERHVWGMGRHHVGSNFFWYLRDPAGNFSEYYSDMDCIVDDQLWEPGVWEGMKSLYNWGPPPPPSFLKPEDLAALMTDAHQ